MKTETTPKFKVGDGATEICWSDCHAYTVIKVTPKSITLQRDDVKLLNGADSGEPDALTVTPGGFAAHVEGVQRYSYTRNPNGYTRKARLRKDGTYRIVGSTERVVEGRYEHYDYNF